MAGMKPRKVFVERYECPTARDQGCRGCDPAGDRCDACSDGPFVERY